MRRELTAGDLLDEKGRLAETGWARSEIRRYRRADIRAPRFRIKEWDYYCVLTEGYGLALTVADNGYMGLLSASWLDFEAPDTFTESIVLPFTRGRMKLPESADAGDIVQRHPKISLSFRHEEGGRRLAVDCPRFAGGRGLRGGIRLDEPRMERMVIATPFPKAPRAFYHNQKINRVSAGGEIEFAGKAHKLGEVTFYIPKGTCDGAPWKFTSGDGRFEMDLEPIVDRGAALDVKILRSSQHQVFGHFSGFVVLDDGSKFPVERFLGFAEEAETRW